MGYGDGDREGQKERVGKGRKGQGRAYDTYLRQPPNRRGFDKCFPHLTRDPQCRFLSFFFDLFPAKNAPLSPRLLHLLLLLLPHTPFCIAALAAPYRTLEYLGDLVRPVQHRECHPRYEIPAVAREVRCAAEGGEEGGRYYGGEGGGHGWCEGLVLVGELWRGGVGDLLTFEEEERLGGWVQLLPVGRLGRWVVCFLFYFLSDRQSISRAK